MVARFGWIMPLPLAMPPSLQVLPPATKDTATSFSLVSVVMMASAASWEPFSCTEAYSSAMPDLMGSMDRGWPMTPVEATITSSAFRPVAWAVSWHICQATSSPSALQVLALPLLQMAA